MNFFVEVVILVCNIAIMICKEEREPWWITVQCPCLSPVIWFCISFCWVTLIVLTIFRNLLDAGFYSIYFFQNILLPYVREGSAPRSNPLPCYIPFLTNYSGTSPLRHLYSSNTSIRGTKNLVPEKCSHNLCICYLYWRETSIQGEGPNPGFTSIQGTP